MSLLKDFFNALEPLAPTGVILCVIILVVIAVRAIIDKRSVGAGKNLRRQVLTILLSFAGR